MRAIMESGFYCIYLIFVEIAGFILLKRNKNGLKLFGLALILLGFGDAFHLVPRAIGLFTDTLDYPSSNLAMWLGIGKFMTSITMTIFYLLYYFFIYKRTNEKRSTSLDITIILLSIIRIGLCFLPQNEWLTNESNVTMGIIRNIPFVVIGVISIMLSNIYLGNTKPFRGIWILITLSFLFYLPVVLFASIYSFIGMMMLPKTICYMLIALLALKDSKNI